MLSARNAMRQVAIHSEATTILLDHSNILFFFFFFSFFITLPSTAYLLYILYPCLVPDL